jgi:hypothetical protein
LIDDLSPELELLVTTSFRGARLDADIFVAADGDKAEMGMMLQILGGGWNNWQLWFIIWGLSFDGVLGNKVEKENIRGLCKTCRVEEIEGFYDAQL